ncbi:MAG: hypothetical protein IJM98_06705 [Oscillospiraceae bacterium]|nr:hypothetical protein [Oscillospiraceae bacterium]
MKKILSLVFVLAFLFAGCSENEGYNIEVIIPAGTEDGFVWAEEEICPVKSSITVSAGAGISSAEVILKSVSDENTTYVPKTIKQQKPADFSAEKDTWYKIGIFADNSSDKDITVSINVKNADIRIE